MRGVGGKGKTGVATRNSKLTVALADRSVQVWSGLKPQ